MLLATRYEPLWAVIFGTTIGMLLANVPVALLGSRFADRLPLKAARLVAAAVFAGLALWVALRRGAAHPHDGGTRAGSPHRGR